MASCWNERCSVLEGIWKIWIVLVFFTCLCYIVQVHNEWSLESQNLRDGSKNLTKRVQELESIVELLKEKMDTLESRLVDQTKVHTADQTESPKSRAQTSRQGSGRNNRSDCTLRRKLHLCIQKQVKALNESFQDVCQKYRGVAEYAQFICQNVPVDASPYGKVLNCATDNDPKKTFLTSNVIRIKKNKAKIIRIYRAGHYFVYAHLVFATATQNTISISYEYNATATKLANVVSKEITTNTVSVDLFGAVYLMSGTGLYLKVKENNMPTIKGQDSFFGLYLLREVDASSNPDQYTKFKLALYSDAILFIAAVLVNFVFNLSIRFALFLFKFDRRKVPG